MAGGLGNITSVLLHTLPHMWVYIYRMTKAKVIGLAQSDVPRQGLISQSKDKRTQDVHQTTSGDLCKVYIPTTTKLTRNGIGSKLDNANDDSTEII